MSVNPWPTYGGPPLVPSTAPKEPDPNQALLRAVLDAAPDPIFLKDCDCRMVIANRAALAVIGKPAGEVLGRTALEYLDDAEAGLVFHNADVRVLETGKVESLEQVVSGPEGPRVFVTTKSPYRDAQGNLAGVIGVSRDITERKASETALRENADRLALILEATSGGFWDWNIQTGDVVFSPRYSTMLGYDPREFAGDYKLWKDLVHPDDVQRVERHYADHFAGLTDYSIEFRMKEKSGNWHWIHSRGLLIERDAEGKPLRMVGTHSDIQSRKGAEEERERLGGQLAHAQKMECVGRLAGGIAHDFSNLMSVILLHTEFALADSPGNDPVSESLTAIQDAAEKAVVLTRQLLAFSHKHEGKPEVLDLNSVLAGCEKLIRPLIGEDVNVVFRPGADVGSVEIDPGQLYQILINLAVNSRDAMPEGGTLTIETASLELNWAGGLDIPDANPGAYVMVSVRDTGVGMEAETLARAFEPFFTTKEVGRGTGLGLSVVYGIVKQSKGHITVHTEPKHGTEFRIYLPVVVATPAPAVETTPPPIPGGGETILLVEDEPSLRHTVGNMLRRAGYRVLIANGADQAIEMSGQELWPIELLLTDIVMPGLSGIEFARYLLGVNPAVKVLFMSGYPDAFEGVRLQPGDNFIQKPFTAPQLLSRVRDLLGRPALGSASSGC